MGNEVSLERPRRKIKPAHVVIEMGDSGAGESKEPSGSVKNMIYFGVGTLVLAALCFYGYKFMFEEVETEAKEITKHTDSRVDIVETEMSKTPAVSQVRPKEPEKPAEVSKEKPAEDVAQTSSLMKWVKSPFVWVGAVALGVGAAFWYAPDTMNSYLKPVTNVLKPVTDRLSPVTNFFKSWFGYFGSFFGLGGAAALTAGSTLKSLQLVNRQGGDGGVKPERGQKLTMNYTGWLRNPDGSKGEKFDSSIGKRPFTFNIGKGQVIKGWDQGIMDMKLGEKAMLEIPSEMGYGHRGSRGSIPPNSDLMFEVELLKIQ